MFRALILAFVVGASAAPVHKLAAVTINKAGCEITVWEHGIGNGNHVTVNAPSDNYCGNLMVNGMNDNGSSAQTSFHP